MSPVYDKVYDHIKNSGVDVFVPGVHEGDCETPYCVLRDFGASQLDNFSTQQVIYILYCYTKNYSDLYDFVEKCKGIMDGIAPLVLPTGQETPSFFDDTNKAYMVSVQYRFNRRCKLL